MDDKGLVDLAELRKSIGKTKYEGKSSIGFRVGDKFIKIYIRKEDGKREFSPPDPTKIVDFSGFVADTIVFPYEYIHENGQKAGEVLQYINSKRFDIALRSAIYPNIMINKYELVINDMHLYSNIDMIDLCYVNILYSNRNGFHLIDTTDWKMAENALKRNIHRFDSSIIDLLISYFEIPHEYNDKLFICVKNNFLDELDKYGSYGKELKRCLLLLSEDKYSFLRFMFAFLDVYRVHYSMDAKTLEDVKELTKVLKNS